MSEQHDRYTKGHPTRKISSSSLSLSSSLLSSSNQRRNKSEKKKIYTLLRTLSLRNGAIESTTQVACCVFAICKARTKSTFLGYLELFCWAHETERKKNCRIFVFLFFFFFLFLGCVFIVWKLVSKFPSQPRQMVENHIQKNQTVLILYAFWMTLTDYRMERGREEKKTICLKITNRMVDDYRMCSFTVSLTMKFIGKMTILCLSSHEWGKKITIKINLSIEMQTKKKSSPKKKRK